MDDDIPVVVRMRVECARCGHSEEDIYKFDMPFARAQAMEAYEPGKCPKCGAPIELHAAARPPGRLAICGEPGV